MIISTGENKYGYDDILVFSIFVLIVGLAFPFSSPEYFHFNFHNILVNSTSYFLLSLSILAIFATRIRIANLRNFSLIYWILYFGIVVLMMLWSGNANIHLGILYLLLFAIPISIRPWSRAISSAIGAAISFNAFYGLAGIFAANLRISYDVFPIVPYIYDGSVKLGSGFYKAFSPALFLQTNAAGAIFGTAFCFFLYQLINDGFRSKVLSLVTFSSLLGLLLTRSLSPLLMAGLLCIIVLRGRALATLLVGAAVYAGLIFFVPGGFFGLNAAYLHHKIESSAFVKLSILSDNLRSMMNDGILALIVPGREPPRGTENSFVDMAYQFGFVQLILFYGWCIMSLRIVEDRYKILLIFPILLSFIQNSTFTTPSVVIFGAALAIYGNKANPSPAVEERHV